MVARKLIETPASDASTPGSVPGAGVLIPPEQDQTPRVAILLDLARLQLKAGSAAASQKLYAWLDGKGKLSNAFELLGYAVSAGKESQQGTVDLQIAERALAALDPDSSEDFEQIALAVARTAGAASAVAAVQLVSSAARKRGGAAAAAVTLRAQLAACAALAASGDWTAAQQVAATADKPQAGATAETVADLTVLRAATAPGTPAAARACLRAVHVCPWSTQHRAVAVSAMAALPAAPAAAASQLAPGTAHGDCVSVPPAAVRIAGLRAGEPTRAALAAVQGACRCAVRALHADPANAYAWYQASVLMTLQAQGHSGDTAAAKRASAMIMRAREVVKALVSTGGMRLRVHLHLATSVALCAEAAAGDNDTRAQALQQEALQYAQAAQAAAASDPELADVQPACAQQVAACQTVAGSAEAAVATLLTGAGTGDSATVLALAAALPLAEAASVLAEAHNSGAVPAHWRAALVATHVNALCAQGSMDEARSVHHTLRDAGSGNAASGVLLASCALSAAEAQPSNARGKLLAEARAALRPAQACNDRVDLAVLGATLGAAAERARGRDDVAADWQRTARDRADAAVAGGLLPQRAAEQAAGTVHCAGWK